MATICQKCKQAKSGGGALEQAARRQVLEWLSALADSGGADLPMLQQQCGLTRRETRRLGIGIKIIRA